MIPFAKRKHDGRLVAAHAASKADAIACLACEHDLLLRKGDVRKPHFAHFPVTHGATKRECYIETSGESAEHATAKLLVAKYLERFKFLRTCTTCCKSHEFDWASVVLERNHGDDEAHFTTSHDGIESPFQLEFRFTANSNTYIIDAMREVVVCSASGSSAKNCYFFIEIRNTHAVHDQKLLDLQTSEEVGGIVEVHADEVLRAVDIDWRVRDLNKWMCNDCKKEVEEPWLKVGARVRVRLQCPGRCKRILGSRFERIEKIDGDSALTTYNRWISLSSIYGDEIDCLLPWACSSCDKQYKGLCSICHTSIGEKRWWSPCSECCGKTSYTRFTKKMIRLASATDS